MTRIAVVNPNALPVSHIAAGDSEKAKTKAAPHSAELMIASRT